MEVLCPAVRLSLIEKALLQTLFTLAVHSTEGAKISGLYHHRNKAAGFRFGLRVLA